MNPAIHEFLDFLENEDDLDVGDFKREVDLHLRYMIDNMRPLTSEQVWQLRKMREQLLWTYKFDVEELRRQLRSQVQHLEDFSPPPL
ncbi:MAG TPA: hypothetical protein VGE46_04525 [Bdellovibrio sp.]